jgi:AcrR family transcriptional regulator
MNTRRRTTPRKAPKQERARVTVDAILDATAHILVKRGYAGATTNRIAERAGVSIGSLYQYFPSKEAILAALLDRHIRETYAVIEAGLPAWSALPLRDAVRAIVAAMIEMHAAQPALHRVLTEQVPRAGRIERVTAVERRFGAHALAFLETHRDEIRPRDLELAAFVLVQTVESLTHEAAVHQPERLASDAFANEVGELVYRYLAIGNQTVTSVPP